MAPGWERQEEIAARELCSDPAIFHHELPLVHAETPSKPSPRAILQGVVEQSGAGAHEAVKPTEDGGFGARSGPVVPAHVALPAMAQQESVFFLLKGAWAKSIKTSWEGTADTSSASSRSITPGGREKIPRPVVLARASPWLTPVPQDECFYKAELERKHCAINLRKAAPNIPAAWARAALDQRGSCTHGCGHAKARAAAEEQLGRLSQPTEILVPFQRRGFT